MKIVFAASEAAPFIKSGGLGDVAQALPIALSEYKDNEVILFLPYYSRIKYFSNFDIERVAEFETQLSWRKQYVGLMKLKSRKRKLRVYFIDNEQYFNREPMYGQGDDGERFAYFCKAILESLVYLGEKPDIIHCNDWQTALLPGLLHTFYHDSLGSAKTVFTIHNIEYQGWADKLFLGNVLGYSDDSESTYGFNGCINFLKGAILTCDSLTTVSETYAKEICNPYFAHGLDGVISEHSFKTTGIINGIDTVGNSPENDKFISKNYNVKTAAEGKAACKADLQRTVGLPENPDVAVVGIVSRLVGHKGLDIICQGMEEMMGAEIQFVVLGTGDERYEKKLASFARKHRDKFSLNLKFNLELASKIYAGADIYLMPSKSEPCGLSQLLAMHYGTVPVVHETGGLRDTVIPFDRTSGKGLGFTFQSFCKNDMLDALWRSLDIYYNDKDMWSRARYNCMSADFSWKKPAEKYMALYKSLVYGV